MNYWLVKQEPGSYSFDDFQKEKKTDWTGVRNYQARNFLRDMQKGDEVLFYHSGDEKAVVGFATVSKEAFQDPTADDPAWIAVELKAGKKLKTPVPLSSIKAEPKLSNILLVRNGRISVMSLTKAEFDQIVKMGS
ncbi:EVE domain-containing protein [Leptolyngbya sp. 7M]|uniref:EVE domain-containing protein n=1 Tax=Leptolyngbya sp. 7M TaxID=2812896 RepID=UPI001B8D3E53|nr:EVE domain-containing protein [Leptolyngbya sp. 7M]QYO66221.1 EVE domain-containing protein [Leptolyngbya sp. 7M]